MRTLLTAFLVWAIYPLWLVAGFFDYLSHRRTHIEATSGATESWLHLAQFLSLGFPLILVTFFEMTPLLLAIVASSVLLHTALGFADVAYTEGRRRIHPFEQHVHGFMTVLPIVAVGLLVVLRWEDIRASEWLLQTRSDPLPRMKAALLLTSYFTLAGVPIIEELVRTSRNGHVLAQAAGQVARR